MASGVHRPRMLVAGIGGIGGWLLARLAEGGADVTGLTRGETFERLNAGAPLELRSVERSWSGPVRVADAPDGPYDLTFVCCKVHDTLSISDALVPGGTIVSVQNGFDGPGLLRRRHERVVAAVVYSGAERIEPTVIVHRTNGFLQVADTELAATLERFGVVAKVVDDLHEALWRKLVNNSVINPICALTRLPIADAVGSSAREAMARAAVAETVAVAVADGAAGLATLDPERIVRGWRTGGGANRPSTLQDVEAGRPLEIDALTGAVVRRAARHGIAVPTLRTLAGLCEGIDPGRPIATVERIDTPEAQQLIAELNTDIELRSPNPEDNFFEVDAEELTGERGAFVVVRILGRPVACGAVRLLDDGERAEVKRMFVRSTMRGRRLGELVLDELERHARALGATVLVLETGESLVEAVALYRRVGFEPCPCWGEYADAPKSLCMRKRIT